MLYPYLFTIRMGISELVEEISKFSIDYSHGQPNLTKMENIHLEFSLSVYVIIRRKTKRAFQFRRSERGIQTVLARKYVLGHVSDVFSEFLRILKINVSLSSI